MIVVRRLLLLHVVLLASCILSALAAGVQAAPVEPQPANPWPPIVFYVAKGEPNACGSGCREWIAAEGTIDENAHRRLHGLLNRLDRRKLPIYFHAPGGSLEAAMAIGRMMRERGMTAGVGRTIPRGCDPLQEHESACDALKRAGRELLAELRTARTLCNSACVYALIGACARSRGGSAYWRARDRGQSLRRACPAGSHRQEEPVAGAAEAASSGRSPARALHRGNGDRQGAVRCRGADRP